MMIDEIFRLMSSKFNPPNELCCNIKLELERKKDERCPQNIYFIYFNKKQKLIEQDQRKRYASQCQGSFIRHSSLNKSNLVTKILM